jgi:deleted-in-malignant-brain-tumors protein 1
LSLQIYRTRGSALPWEGRLEVRVDGVWGTVCDTDFTIEEANIVCRAMGYGSATTYRYRAFYGRGVGPIHYTDLRYVMIGG